MGNNSFLRNASSYFTKLMQQQYIAKSEIIKLKRQFTTLRIQHPGYNALSNRITNIANKAKGKNTVDILQDAYNDFNHLKS
ncbi:MAG: hypothetical protein WCJ45_06590 [bacterium]